MICVRQWLAQSAKLDLSADKAVSVALLAGGSSMKARLHSMFQTWLQMLGLVDAPRLEPVRVMTAEELRRRQLQQRLRR